MENHEIDILLVEDNPEDADLTIRALKKSSITTRVLHLKDGAAALDYIFCTGEYSDRNMALRPKVILLDLNMPKISGTEVLKRIKADDRTKVIPVVVLTSSKESPDVDNCYMLGANSYIVKPVGFENFTKTITELGLFWVLRNHQ